MWRKVNEKSEKRKVEIDKWKDFRGRIKEKLLKKERKEAGLDEEWEFFKFLTGGNRKKHEEEEKSKQIGESKQTAFTIPL